MQYSLSEISAPSLRRCCTSRTIPQFFLHTWWFAVCVNKSDCVVCSVCFAFATVLRTLWCVVCAKVCSVLCTMGWLRLVGFLKLLVSFAKEPYKRDDNLQKRPIILRSLLILATPYVVYLCDIVAHVLVCGVCTSMYCVVCGMCSVSAT